MTTRNKRLKKVEQTLRTRPIKPEVARAAHERFRKTGELPEEQHIAAQVVELVQSGLDAKIWMACNGDEKALIRAYVCAPPRPKDEVMDRLLGEAVYGDEMVRWAARKVLKGLAGIGMDVTEPLFAGEPTWLPDHGSAGFGMMGFPESLAKPPYEEQGLRLFERYALLRKRINQGDKRWWDEWAVAVGLFRNHGELPDDDLLREAVLADSELLSLTLHEIGEGDPEVMAAFDAVATASGEERAVATLRLQQLVRQSGFLRSDYEAE